MERVLIIDDHPIFIDGLVALVNNLMPSAKVTTCENGIDALKLLDSSVSFDWIFLDINLPDISGFDVLKHVLGLKLLSNVLVVSSDEDPAIIHRVFELHASGYISKQFNTMAFQECIKTIRQGDVFLDERLSILLKDYREGVFIEKKYIQDHISQRQLEALKMIAKGMTNIEIAELMNVKQSTVKSHISLLMGLFNADNRSHCVAEAKRLGILK